MIKAIKIAGLGLNWTEQFAILYKNKLFEVGFDSRILNKNGDYFVAYSHKTFTEEEAEKVLNNILEDVEND